MEFLNQNVRRDRPPSQLKVDPVWFYGVMIAGVMVWVFQAIGAIHQNRSRLKLPPGPRRWPVVGNLPNFGSLPHHSLMELSKKYGELMYMKLGIVHAVVVSSPEMAEEFLKVQDGLFAGRPHGVQSKAMFYNNQSLILSEGDLSRFLRKLCVVEIFNVKRIKDLADIRAEEILKTVEHFLEKGKDRELVKVDIVLNQSGFNNISRIIFGKTYYGSKATGSPSESEIFRGLVRDHYAAGTLVLQDFIPILRLVDPGGAEAKIKKVSLGYDDFLNKKLEEHRARDATCQDTFLDVLLKLQKSYEKSEKGADFSDDMLKALVMDFISAGAETTSGIQAWVLTELMRHPEIRQKAVDELDSVVGRDRLVREADLPNLKYLKCVIRETFRLHPVLPFLVPHESMAATKIAGYDIPNRTRVFINIYAIGRDPKVWENPLHYNPDRFLDSPINEKGLHFELIPFGSGRRTCVARNFALILVELNLAQLLHTCDFRLPPGMKPLDVDMEETFGEQITVPKKHPLEVTASPRLPLHVYEEAGLKL